MSQQLLNNNKNTSYTSAVKMMRSGTKSTQDCSFTQEHHQRTKLCPNQEYSHKKSINHPYSSTYKAPSFRNIKSKSYYQSGGESIYQSHLPKYKKSGTSVITKKSNISRKAIFSHPKRKVLEDDDEEISILEDDLDICSEKHSDSESFDDLFISKKSKLNRKNSNLSSDSESRNSVQIAKNGKNTTSMADVSTNSLTDEKEINKDHPLADKSTLDTLEGDNSKKIKKSDHYLDIEISDEEFLKIVVENLKKMDLKNITYRDF